MVSYIDNGVNYIYRFRKINGIEEFLVNLNIQFVITNYLYCSYDVPF